jgi:hypothetical protein
VEVLLGYLQAQGGLRWPGSDSLTIEEVLASYTASAEKGHVPDEEELCQRHPRLTGEVRLLFTQGTARLLARCARYDR